VEDYIEKEKDRLYRGQGIKTLEEEYKIIEENRG